MEKIFSWSNRREDKRDCNAKPLIGAVAQLGERRPCKAEVVGSTPISSTK